MTQRQQLTKRCFDTISCLVGLCLLWPVILVSWLIARKDTGASGFFIQKRVGQGGHMFNVIKLRTMREVGGTTVTTANDARITKWGARFRRWKIDELPQLWNVIWGDMSIVGPRPDVPGYIDQLQGSDRRLLLLKPGITGPATLKYRDEEQLLAKQSDPKTYNDEVIWPDKVRLNLIYLEQWSLRKDIEYIIKTISR